jgi:hypothetical protein
MIRQFVNFSRPSCRIVAAATSQPAVGTVGNARTGIVVSKLVKTQGRMIVDLLCPLAAQQETRNEETDFAPIGQVPRRPGCGAHAGLVVKCSSAL